MCIRDRRNRRAYQALVAKRGRRAVFDDDEQLPNESELKEWRLWIENVFMPGNEFIEKLITEKAYLIRESEMPDCLLQVITHVSGYRVIINKWQQGDFKENLSIVDFPEELGQYAQEAYQELKAEQLKLIGK